MSLRNHNSLSESVQEFADVLKMKALKNGSEDFELIFQNWLISKCSEQVVRETEATSIKFKYLYIIPVPIAW